jgi:hypothetical protein
MGAAPAPIPLPHFPDRLHAFVWRNWPLVPSERLARVVEATPDQVSALARSMGLPRQKPISMDQQKRSALTIIRRNWQLLPYDQLLSLLDWTPAQMAFALKEDDFLFIKLGSLKPRCGTLRYAKPTEAATRRAREIASLVRREFPHGVQPGPEPLFGFLKEFKSSVAAASPLLAPPPATAQPRYCYSYFALYGDPLLEPSLDPYPEGYLDRLRQCGVNGVWLQGVLHQLSSFPWDETISRDWQKRLDNLRTLANRCRQRGLGLYLYLNEPRTMPLRFFQAYPDLRGVVAGDVATLCTSHPEVQRYLAEAVTTVCRAAPDLAGFFTITASENLTNCWSHGNGAACPRCGKRSPGGVIAGVNECVAKGIRAASSSARLFAWDWGWADSWAPEAIQALPPEAALMSVSEWSIPITRGGTQTTVGEYSISVVGPGPRARKHWRLAKERGLKILAKVQAGNTWELSAVPYIPAVENVARHRANLRAENIDGMMLGWTLGGYPSPNLEVVAQLENHDNITDALLKVATRRYGELLAPAVVQAWRDYSAAFSNFPFHGSLVYNAPMQYGPANLVWEQPTGYAATMVGFPYDDLDRWRAVYPAEVFVTLFREMGEAFSQAVNRLEAAVRREKRRLHRGEKAELSRELDVARAASIHFLTTSNQARFILLRRQLQKTKSDRADASLNNILDEMESLLREEIRLAKDLHAIQSRDSRIGFEASNQYYYVPADLAEKVLNCDDLLKRWIPKMRGDR